jgi:hypothetical protein
MQSSLHPPEYRYVIGYHGTDKSIADMLIQEGPAAFEPSQNAYDWLGHGIYFYEHSLGRAQEWVDTHLRHPSPATRAKFSEGGIVGAVIDLGNCLDLLEPMIATKVAKAHPMFCKQVSRDGRPLPMNQKAGAWDLHRTHRFLDCAVINYLAGRRKLRRELPFDTVRGGFGKGNPLFAGSDIQNRTHVQIAVRDRAVIKQLFKPVDYISDAKRLWA